jgi:broad specificity phosphatase PhoE
VTTFYLVRHGSNDFLARGLAGRLPEVHLNAQGREEAARLAQFLSAKPISRIISSPLERCRETAEPLATALKLPVEISETVLEVNFGEWQGASIPSLEADERWRKWNAFRTGHRLPGGETMISIQARVANELIRLRHENPGAHIAIFAHGDPIRAALGYWLGMPLDFLHRLEVSPGSLSIVMVDDWQAKVECINYRPG